MAGKQKTRAPKGTLLRVLSYLRGYRFYLFASLLLAFAVVALTLWLPVLVGDAIDCITEGHVDFDRIRSIFLTALFVICGNAVLTWFMNICNNKMTYGIVRNIRNDAFTHLQKVPIAYLDNHKAGDIVSRIIADVDQFSDGLLLGFTQLFTGVMTILGTLLFMVRIHAGITLVVVLVTPVSLFVAAFIAKRTYRMFRLQNELKGAQTALMEESIGQRKTVAAFSREEDFLSRFDEQNQKLQKAALNATFFSSITNPSTRFVNSLVYTGVALVGALAVIGGTGAALTVGQLSCFLSYANQYTKPFNEISGVVTELQNALSCAARIFEILDTPIESENPENAVVLKNPRGEVVFDHVAFSYVPEKPLITDMNLTVKPGQRVAIVGPTGCGKTTVINLLMRFYDVQNGSISIDGTDIRQMTRKSLRESVGMVLQETWLKAGTVRDNIAFAKPDATDDEVIAAAKAAHAHGFIKRLPKGYHTKLGEEGGSLSQGQKQLLCIARLMLSPPPMLILDEATSSIDTRTEIRIQKAFATLMRGRTSFVVAHRLSTIRESDIILVMRDGNVIEQGDHESLLQKKGFYYNLYNSQFAK